MDSETVRIAEVYLKPELLAFMRTVPYSERKDFFDPRNRDTWQREFGHFLFSREREFASND